MEVFIEQPRLTGSNSYLYLKRVRLDGVGGIDNIPSTEKLHDLWHVKQKKIMTCDTCRTDI